MKIEGGLQIILRCESNQVQEVEIHSQRPLQVVRLFHGKAIAEVLRTLPLLFHVCGMAQSNAAVTAFEQAMSINPAESIRQAREMLIWVETAREHLWRILMGWADKTGQQKDKTAIALLQKFLPRLKQALFADGNGFYPGAQVTLNIEAAQTVIKDLEQLLQRVVFAMPVEQWLQHYNSKNDKQSLQSWLDKANTVAATMINKVATMEQEGRLDAAVEFLPLLDENTLHQHLQRADAEHFVAQPQWEGKPCETGVLSRQQHQPLVAAVMKCDGKGLKTRILARLVELAQIPGILKQLLQELSSAPQTSNTTVPERHSGVGLAQVEAVRGRLVHRIELEHGIVQRYQILAPTEWNFHPQGIAAQLLKRLPVQDEIVLKQRAELLINSIDPCVRYQMSVH